MDQSMPNLSELTALAERNALEVLSLEAREGNGSERSDKQIEEFRQRWQPCLSDKQYTALFRTYSDLFLVAAQNHLKPGSAIAKTPVTAESIADGDEIYRPSVVAMNADAWRGYLVELQRMAEENARQIAILASSGGDSQRRMEEQQMEVARLGISRGLNDGEFAKQASFYKAALLKALELETQKRLGVPSKGADPSAPEFAQGSGRVPNGQSLGNLAVRTAVRATVWESVRAILRFFR